MGARREERGKKKKKKMKSLIREKSEPKEIRNSLMFCSIQKQLQVMTLFLRDFKAWGIKIKVATMTDRGDEKVTPKPIPSRT